MRISIFGGTLWPLNKAAAIQEAHQLGQEIDSITKENRELTQQIRALQAGNKQIV